MVRSLTIVSSNGWTGQRVVKRVISARLVILILEVRHHFEKKPMSIDDERCPSTTDRPFGKMAAQRRKSGYRRRRPEMRHTLSRIVCPVWALALTAFAAAIGLSSPAAASLLVINGTFLTMRPGETAPFVGYMLVGDDGKVSGVCQT